VTDPTPSRGSHRPSVQGGIALDGYVLVRRDDLPTLTNANEQPALKDPACPAYGASSADPPEPLLTVRQAAHQLSLSPSAVHNYISSHQLPVIRLGRAVRIQPTDLAEFILQHRQKGNGRGQ